MIALILLLVCFFGAAISAQIYTEDAERFMFLFLGGCMALAAALLLTGIQRC